MALSTRDRILTTARRMFNAHGFGNVTVERLSDAVGIAPGNLWYHFKTKADLVAAIAEQFTEHVQKRSDMRPSGSDDPDALTDDFIRFLTAYAEELRQFRFLFRDQADYGAHNPSFAKDIPALYEQYRQQCFEYFEAFIAAGLMNFPPERLHDLSVNTTILFRYGLEYQRESGQATLADTGTVKRVIQQILTLFSHALDEQVAKNIQTHFA